jgi:hypothetical protein
MKPLPGAAGEDGYVCMTAVAVLPDPFLLVPQFVDFALPRPWDTLLLFAIPPPCWLPASDKDENQDDQEQHEDDEGL